MLRQKWLMLAVFLAIAGPSVPAVWYLTVPMYESTAIVRVEPVVPKMVFSTENNGMLPLYREYMNTQVNAIRNPKVLERVLDRKEIQGSQWYREEGKRALRDPLPALERLAKALSVQTRRDTQLISVSISTPRGAEAKMIVDAVVDEYYGLTKERERTEYLELIGKVREQYATLETEIRGLRELRKSLSRDSGLMDSLELRTQLSTTLNDYESRYMELDRECKLLTSRLEKLSGSSSQPSAESAPAADLSPDVAFLQDVEWRELRRQEQRAQHELELALGHFSEETPRVKELRSSLAFAEDLRIDREKQIRGSGGHIALSSPRAGASGNDPVVGTAQSLPEKQLARDLLQKDIDKMRGKVTDIQTITRNEEQLREKEAVFASVRDRLTTLEMESKAPGRIGIESYGLKPSEPDSDRRPLMSVMAVGGALMAALALGYVRTLADSRIHEVEDVQHMSAAPFLGRLPLLTRAMTPRELGGDADCPVLPERPEVAANSYGDPNSLSAISEGVRMIRTALLERLGSTPDKRAILITSPTSQAGKSALALLLSRSLASTGKTVLLVEGDFYRPSLASRLGLTAGAGLAALLSRKVDDAQAIRGTAIPTLSVLPVGELCDQFSPEVLANGVFAKCMARWKRSYDFIVMDSPPVLPVADARILASHTDGALLVVRATHNRRSEALNAFNYLASTRAGVLGVVMIGGASPTPSYSYGDYPYMRTPGDPDGTPRKPEPDTN